MNAEFQSVAKKDKKAFLNEQCKEVEESNKIEHSRNLITKVGAIKRTFHARMGTIKDRKRKDITEAEEIKKKWQEYTEGLSKKVLNDLDNHSGVATHLEPDILECQVKWALGSITRNKASGGDGIHLQS